MDTLVFLVVLGIFGSLVYIICHTSSTHIQLRINTDSDNYKITEEKTNTDGYAYYEITHSDGSKLRITLTRK